MTKQETLITPYGEMMDMLTCAAIQNGTLEPKERKMSFDEALALR